MGDGAVVLQLDMVDYLGRSLPSIFIKVGGSVVRTGGQAELRTWCFADHTRREALLTLGIEPELATPDVVVEVLQDLCCGSEAASFYVELLATHWLRHWSMKVLGPTYSEHVISSRGASDEDDN